MARLIDNKFLFIHVAKTGGTFFREIINIFGIPSREIGKKHGSFSDVQGDLPQENNTVPIGFVRDPLTWYRSRWAFAVMSYFGDKIKYMPEAQNHWMAKIWSYDLNEFVANTLKVYPNGIATEYFRRMLRGVDRELIFRYEDINEVAHKLVSRCLPIGSVTLERYRAAAKMVQRPLDSSHMKSSIDKELQKEIQRVEFEVYKEYGYEQSFHNPRTTKIESSPRLEKDNFPDTKNRAKC